MQQPWASELLDSLWMMRKVRQCLRCAGVDWAGWVSAAAGCNRHATKEGARPKSAQQAQDWGGCGAPASQPHSGPPKHAGSCCRVGRGVPVTSPNFSFVRCYFVWLAKQTAVIVDAK